MDYPGLGHCDSDLGRQDFGPDGVGLPDVRPDGSTPPNLLAPGSVSHQSSHSRHRQGCLSPAGHLRDRVASRIIHAALQQST